MFCPNCGTQNPDTAQACSKCNFQLKSAAAPKFKGTMLMMNQPGAATPHPPPPPGVPPHGAPPPVPGAVPGAPRPVGAVGPAPGAANRLKGTMVGVAPMGGIPGAAPAPGAPPGSMGGGVFPGGPPPAPGIQPTQPSAAVPMPGAPPGAPPPAMGGHEAAFSPPIPQAGVNPLGGTVAADAAAFGSAFGPPQGAAPGASPYGPPPGQQGFPPPPHGQPPMPYGAPPGAPGPYGAPPPGPYGNPPQQGYGPNPYGPPPQQGYGPPMGMGPAPGMAPMAGYGQPPPGAMAQGVGVGTLQSAGVSPGPRRRNPLLTLLLPVAIIFGGVFFGVILSMLISQYLAFLAVIAYLAGVGLILFNTIQMANELKAVTRSPGFAWWPIFVPIYGMYWAWILVPQEVAKAKQMLGVQAPVRSIVLYIFLWPFALASDINDMAR